MTSYSFHEKSDFIYQFQNWETMVMMMMMMMSMMMMMMMIIIIIIITVHKKT